MQKALLVMEVISMSGKYQRQQRRIGARGHVGWDILSEDEQV